MCYFTSEVIVCCKGPFVKEILLENCRMHMVGEIGTLNGEEVSGDIVVF